MNYNSRSSDMDEADKVLLRDDLTTLEEELLSKQQITKIRGKVCTVIYEKKNA